MRTKKVFIFISAIIILSVAAVVFLVSSGYLDIFFDESPPEMQVGNIPEILLMGERQLISVRAHDASPARVSIYVFLDGKRIQEPYEVYFDSPGIHDVVVEAVDGAGNISRRSYQVTVVDIDERRLQVVRDIERSIAAYADAVGSYPLDGSWSEVCGALRTIKRPPSLCPDEMSEDDRIDYTYEASCYDAPDAIIRTCSSYVLRVSLDNSDLRVLAYDVDSQPLGINCVDPHYCIVGTLSVSGSKMDDIRNVNALRDIREYTQNIFDMDGAYPLCREDADYAQEDSLERWERFARNLRMRAEQVRGNGVDPAPALRSLDDIDRRYEGRAGDAFAYGYDAETCSRFILAARLQRLDPALWDDIDGYVLGVNCEDPVMCVGEVAVEDYSVTVPAQSEAR